MNRPPISIVVRYGARRIAVLGKSRASCCRASLVLTLVASMSGCGSGLLQSPQTAGLNLSSAIPVSTLPVSTADPVVPPIPVTPVAPVVPVVPVTPVAPVMPVAPIVPIVPVTPIVPVAPGVPVVPIAPIVPVTPVVVPPATFSAALKASTEFIGASIVQRWPMPIHNDGVSGETTTQILARFKVAVLGHGYKRVVILCGTNDILQDTKDLSTEAAANIQTMALMAKWDGIQVILSLLPAIRYPDKDFGPQVAAVNASIAKLALEQGYLVVDYHAALAGHPEDYIDTVHPNAAGYAAMEKALSAVVLE